MGKSQHEGEDDGATTAVRCLSCLHVYGRPGFGGTAARNPGCPACGYVGWLSIGALVSPFRPHELRA